MPQHIQKGGLRHGHNPKKRGLRHGHNPKKGGLRHGHEPKKGGLRHGHESKKAPPPPPGDMSTGVVVASSWVTMTLSRALSAGHAWSMCSGFVLAGFLIRPDV